MNELPSPLLLYVCSAMALTDDAGGRRGSDWHSAARRARAVQRRRVDGPGGGGRRHSRPGCRCGARTRVQLQVEVLHGGSAQWQRVTPTLALARADCHWHWQPPRCRAAQLELRSVPAGGAAGRRPPTGSLRPHGLLAPCQRHSLAVTGTASATVPVTVAVAAGPGVPVRHTAAVPVCQPECVCAGGANTHSAQPQAASEAHWHAQAGTGRQAGAAAAGPGRRPAVPLAVPYTAIGFKFVSTSSM